MACQHPGLEYDDVDARWKYQREKGKLGVLTTGCGVANLRKPIAGFYT